MNQKYRNEDGSGSESFAPCIDTGTVLNCQSTVGHFDSNIAGTKLLFLQ